MEVTFNVPAYKRTPTKINTVLANCPPGVPMSSVWLESQGISPQLLQTYKNSGWLEPLGRGCWIRAGTEPTRTGAIYALQQIPTLNVHPAARSALESLGQAHYIPLGKAPALQLSMPSGQRPPDWFKKLEFSENLHVLNASVLFDPITVGLVNVKNEGIVLKVSSPERAMMEYCQLLPHSAEFEEAQQLMEGLPTLRPRLLQSTLQACRSVKAKRLFLALAESVGHHWFGEIEISEIDLGFSNRILPTDGVSHPRFRITVPKTWIIE